MPNNMGRKEDTMIGIIITGHGTFGSGISSAVELLTGHQDFIVPVDFRGEQPPLTAYRIANKSLFYAIFWEALLLKMQ